MHCLTVGDLRKAIENRSDSEIVVLAIYDENSPEESIYQSDIDRESFEVDIKSGYQTADGDQDIVRLHAHICIG